MCNEILPKSMEELDKSYYSFAAAFDWTAGYLCACIGLMRIGSVCRLFFAGELKELFWKANPNPYFELDNSSDRINYRPHQNTTINVSDRNSQ